MDDGTRLLLLPGWRDADAAHGLGHWQAGHGHTRVEQADWHWPRRGDWMARLEEVLLEDARPALLVAHGLGCHLVAAWAAHSGHGARVKGALLVAPPDTERADTPPQLHNWRPIVRQRLPFPALLLYSSDDPQCAADRALALAADWGAAARCTGAARGIDGAAGLGSWPDGLAVLQALMPLPLPLPLPQSALPDTA